MTELTLKPKAIALDRRRYEYMRDDAATLKEIESLIDHGVDGEELANAVKQIIAEMRAKK